MKTPEIYERLKEIFGEAIFELVAEEHSDAFISVSPKKIKDICLYLRDNNDLQFDYLINLSGMDYKDTFGVVYHLYSVKNHYDTVLKVQLDRENPVVDSIERVWKSANWHEREAWDMFGIKFEGHPNLIRILCPYDWEGFPLRKDYVTPEFYKELRVPY